MTAQQTTSLSHSETARREPPVTLRWCETLTTAERDGLSRLFARVVETATTLGYPAASGPERAAEFVDDIADGLSRRNLHLLLVASEPEHFVGMVLLRQDSQPNCTHIGELSKGMVDPDWRGRGIVTLVMPYIVRRAALIGVDLLKLDVRSGSPAEKQWRGFGFSEYGRLEDYARIDGRRYAGVYLFQSVASLARNLETRER